MPTSLFAPDFQAVLDAATATPPPPASQPAFASPADWRDQWIYFLMVDRFNNTTAKPLHPPFDDPNCFQYQGGKFSGIRAQLPYIKGLGAGALWLSPVLKNAKFDQGSYHGYGIQDFLSANPFFADDPTHADDELRALVDAAHDAGLYVIFDIVLNHAANAFAYASNPTGNDAPYSDNRLAVQWRDADGKAQAAFTNPAAVPHPSPDELVWPVELQQNEYFRRQGDAAPYDDTVGDFVPFKQFSTWETDVQNFLIRAYQYVIARYDIDAFRIDTLRYLKGDLPQIFGNSMREFALSIGKKNFFTFGEVLDGNAEADIAKFIGRNTVTDQGDLVGVDAALDFPLFNTLVPVTKGATAPQALVDMYHQRKQTEENILSSHGDATRFFVTFLDTHDSKARIRYIPPGGKPIYDNQVTAGLACLLALPGIPCIYYGTEAGLHGRGTDPAVREALWGGPGFDTTNPFYQQIAEIADVRANQAALRYGRFYFRPISGNKQTFGISNTAPGILAFSRILNDQEVVVVANFSTTNSQQVWVILDSRLSSAGDTFAVLYSNLPAPAAPTKVQIANMNVTVNEVDGSQGTGPVNVIQVTLRAMEAQIFRKS